MRVSATKTKPRVERNIYLVSKKIKGYGLDNDYPQKILEIVGSSGTGKSCVDITVGFVNGAGFNDIRLQDTIINSRKERAGVLLRKVAKDAVHFNGFAVLVKYNGLGEPDEFYNIPFEHTRIEIDSKKAYTGRIAVHPDWTGMSGLQFRNEDVMFLTTYNPAAAVGEMIQAGGPENYPGQIYWWTSDGDFEYPTCPFDPIVTDMLTEESCSTVKHRNAKFNFLPSGILVRKGIKPKLTADGTIDSSDRYNEEQEESREEIKRLQGDENACKMWVVDIDSDEEKPELISFNTRNLDKEYTYTEESVQNNIGRMFRVPPLLRGEDVGAGFGADLMVNAYEYMNSMTGTEREALRLAFKDLLRYFPGEFTDTSIRPLKYIE